jgi:hypothetical protein
MSYSRVSGLYTDHSSLRSITPFGKVVNQGFTQVGLSLSPRSNISTVLSLKALNVCLMVEHI